MKLKSTFAAPLLMMAVLILFLLSKILEEQILSMGESPYLSLIVVQLLVYALPAVFFCRLREKNYIHRLRLRLFLPKNLFLMLFALTAMISGSALINMGMQALFPEVEMAGLAAGYEGALAGDFVSMTYVVLTFCVVPALLEEFLFRGILLAEYETVSVPLAVWMSSLSFAVLHLNFIRFPAYLFSGLVLALTTYATRSVVATMLVHVANNVAVLFLDRYLNSAAAETRETGVLLLFLLACAFLLSLIFFAFCAQYTYKGYGEAGVQTPYLPQKKRRNISVLEAVTAPPFILFFVLAILFAVIL